MTKLYVTLTMLAYNVSDRLKKEEKGATAVEYGLLVGLIAVVIIGAVVILGEQLRDMFTGVSDELVDAPVVVGG